MSRAYCCEVCEAADPHWVVERWGDAVVTWACDADLAQVCERLQRDHEVTKLSVRDSRKAREWAGIGRSLDAIADGGSREDEGMVRLMALARWLGRYADRTCRDLWRGMISGFDWLWYG